MAQQFCVNCTARFNFILLILLYLFSCVHVTYSSYGTKFGRTFVPTNCKNTETISDEFQNKRHYEFFPNRLRLSMKNKILEMFYNVYDNYLQHAFPDDELNPIDCAGRGSDKDDPDNININDVLGDYSLSLIESLTTLAVMGNRTEFKRVVLLITRTISFAQSSTVQVFEVTIRVIGALLSSHLMIIDPSQPFGDLRPADYANELLSLAHDLANRLLPAFDNTKTGLPFPREAWQYSYYYMYCDFMEPCNILTEYSQAYTINLHYGVMPNSITETCTAGAGSILLEFGLLSRLLDDPVFDSLAKRSIDTLWLYRNRTTGLLGNVIDIQSGSWIGKMSGVGAGIDSFYEYLLKSFILFGNRKHERMFQELISNARRYMRRGRRHCNRGKGSPPIYVNVDMDSGSTLNNWIDSLSASWPAVLVLNGDIDEAVCLHALYYSLWKKYGVLPERYNWHLKEPEVKFYPLRPELVESTYMLYQATKNPFYLHVGKDIVDNLNRFAKVRCGYATIHDVTYMDHEDRTESFFLSETCKYLYLLFDTENPLNKAAEKYIYTTEGHPIPLLSRFRDIGWSDVFNTDHNFDSNRKDVIVDKHRMNSSSNCQNFPFEKQFQLPFNFRYLHQYEEAIGLYD